LRYKLDFNNLARIIAGGVGPFVLTGRAAALAYTPTGGGANWYASTTGNSGNPGTIGSPWDLQTALVGGPNNTEVQPGDTVWLRGGTYTPGVYNSDGPVMVRMQGTSGSPIHVKEYPGEVAVIDVIGAGIAYPFGLQIHSKYVWMWGFTVTSSATSSRRSAQSGSQATDVLRAYSGIGVYQDANNFGTGCKFINLYVKNCKNGFGYWTQARDSEIYGCIVYYNGWDGTDRGHGHGIYTQNDPPYTHQINDCISWGNFGYCVQNYSEGSTDLANTTIHGNILDGGCNPSQLYGAVGDNLWCGGGPNNAGPAGTVITDNAFWAANWDLHGGNVSPTITGNYYGGSGELYFVNQTGSPTITGNTTFPTTYDLTRATFAANWPTNSWLTSRPSGVWSVVRPNAYQSGRGHIAIYNWDGSATVAVNCSSFLNNGETYAVYHAMNPRGAAALTGTFGGTTINFPMTGLTVETPTGTNINTPSVTAPDFAAFIVVKT
jgi:hypothetical protein